jgi:hypothetical protein
MSPPFLIFEKALEFQNIGRKWRRANLKGTVIAKKNELSIDALLLLPYKQKTYFREKRTVSSYPIKGHTSITVCCAAVCVGFLRRRRAASKLLLCAA